MNTRKLISNLAVLMAILIIPAKSIGLTRNREEGEPDGLNQSQGTNLIFPIRNGHILAIGVPEEDIYYNGTTFYSAGAVNVLYGYTFGLSTNTNQTIYKDHNLPGIPTSNDNLGQALAVGDFDGNGSLDLAIGIPGHDFSGPINDAGMVYILYGENGKLDPDPLYAPDPQALSQLGDWEYQDSFGAALAVGDFNGDGYEDLAVGVPEENVGTAEDAGAVEVFYGSDSGLASSSEVWNQDTGFLFAQIEDSSEPLDRFGSSLASADFDRDGYDDLAIGVIWEDTTSDLNQNAGGVNVIYGSGSGLTIAGDQFFKQDDLSNSTELSEDGDHFGTSLTVGDFNGDHYADLAIGVPYDDYGSSTPARGVVHIIYGSTTGLSKDNDVFLSQGFLYEETAEALDKFGYALTAGDFDCDGYDDLAVGVPQENPYTTSATDEAGAVQVFYGADTGFAFIEDVVIHQGYVNIDDDAEEGDHFGSALAAGYFNGDSCADLAIGVIYEGNVGAVNILYGFSPDGLDFDNTTSQLWYQDDFDESVSETFDFFGNRLASYYRVKTHVVFMPFVMND